METVDTVELLPHNLEAEQSVIGACLIDPDAIPRVASILKAGDFYDSICRDIWRAAFTIHERNEPIDLMTVNDEMGGDSMTQLITLTNEVPTSVHAEHYANMVAQDAARRRYLDASSQIAKAAFDRRPPEQVEELALKLIMDARANTNGRMKGLSRLVREYYDKIEALARRDGTLGLPTGYGELDKIVGGLQRSDLIILAARPRMGKSSLAMCIARNVVKSGKRVLFFSLEMSSDQLMRRLTALESNISISVLKQGKLHESQWPSFMQSQDDLDSLPLWIDDSPGITPSYMRAEAMRLEATVGPLDLIIVDYLQLMRPGSRMSRYEAVTEIGQALKGIAKDLNVPLLALSQVNRNCENRSDKRPQLHDLRESGDLEQTSNVVMTLYRDEIYDPDAAPGLAEIAVVKNRDGAEGTVNLHFLDHLARFSSVEITRETL